MGLVVSEKKIFLVFPIVSLWDLSVAMETTILIQSAPKPNAINGPKHFLLYIFWQKQPPVYPSPHRLEFQMKALELSHQALGQRMTSLDKDLNIILMLKLESREEKKYLKVGSY